MPRPRPTRLRTALEAAQREVVLSGGMRLRQEWWRARRAGIDKANRALRAGLADLLATGGVPKDLELGLVDFLGLVSGREVNLCWRYGEKRIRFGTAWTRVSEAGIHAFVCSGIDYCNSLLIRLSKVTHPICSQCCCQIDCSPS